MKSFLLRRLPQLGLMLVILLLTGYLSSRQSLFFTPGTVAQIFKYYSPMAMLALGMTFVILTGGIDLSVGFMMMLLMFVMAGLARDHPALPPLLLLSAGMGTALLVGGLLGGAIAYGRIPAFIVTLAAMVAAYGVTLVISQNQSIRGLPAPLLWLGGTEFRFLGETFPIMLPIVVLAYGGAALLLNQTQFGRRLYALGSNREATRLSGVNVPRTEMAAYILSGLCCWTAAWMQIGINRTADPKVALSDSLELNAIAIVVIGGTSLAGGRGGVFGTALGATLLSLIFYGLPLVGINEPSYKKLIQAGIILLGAIFDTLQRRYGKAKD
jgi:ribose transport system permease protein